MDLISIVQGVLASINIRWKTGTITKIRIKEFPDEHGLMEKVALVELKSNGLFPGVFFAAQYIDDPPSNLSCYKVEKSSLPFTFKDYKHKKIRMLLGHPMYKEPPYYFGSEYYMGHIHPVYRKIIDYKNG